MQAYSPQAYRRSDFGDDFVWGVSASAWQTEGMRHVNGKGDSIWDTFARKRKSLHQQALYATDFYQLYRDDLLLMKEMGIRHFRFSISWSRVLPQGTGAINQEGIDFYNRLIDECLHLGIEPWITLYHWDLPQHLQDKGGWRNRDMVGWFAEYTQLVTGIYGDRVKKWMVLNEPMVYTGAGHFLGVHAPGIRSLRSFLKSIHHTALVQGSMPEVIRSMVTGAEIGTTFSCAHLEPFVEHEKHVRAMKRADVLLNRLFPEVLAGNGYPVNDFPALERLNDMVTGEDLRLMKGEYDFAGVQNYTREIIRHAWYIPYLKAKIMGASKRKVPHTLMNWEVHPTAIYHVLKKFSAYPFVKKIYITENGGAFDDRLVNGEVADTERENFLRGYIGEVLRAKNEGVNVAGYFVWSFTDNIEWAEGYRPRFGIVYVDFDTQKRYIKQSGKWYARFLKERILNHEILNSEIERR